MAVDSGLHRLRVDDQGILSGLPRLLRRRWGSGSSSGGQPGVVHPDDPAVPLAASTADRLNLYRRYPPRRPDFTGCGHGGRPSRWRLSCSRRSPTASSPLPPSTRAGRSSATGRSTTCSARRRATRPCDLADVVAVAVDQRTMRDERASADVSPSVWRGGAAERSSRSSDAASIGDADRGTGRRLPAMRGGTATRGLDWLRPTSVVRTRWRTSEQLVPAGITLAIGRACTA